MFLGPLESSKPWSEQGTEGITRFLDRTWRLFMNEDGTISDAVQDIEPTKEQERVLHATIKKTREDIDALSMNTAIAQFMIFVNQFTSESVRSRSALEQYLQCLAPFAPHITEELWSRLGHNTSIHLSSMPDYDESKLIADEHEIVFQVNSKIRGKQTLPIDADKEMLETAAREDEGVKRHLEGKTIHKTIVVPGKLVNFIAK